MSCKIIFGVLELFLKDYLSFIPLQGKLGSLTWLLSVLIVCSMFILKLIPILDILVKQLHDKYFFHFLNKSASFSLSF